MRPLLLLGTLLLALHTEAIFIPRPFPRPVQPAPNNLQCNFQSKSCPWDGIDQWKWYQLSGGKVTLKLDGPIANRNNFNSAFALLADFSNSTTKQPFQITSPVIADSGTQQHCFSFSYYIMVDEAANTELRLSYLLGSGQPTSLWYSGRRNADTWGSTQVTLEQRNSMKLKFSATAKEGFIGLKDFLVRPGRCDGRICNLEADDCGWTTIGTPSNYAYTVVKANATQMAVKKDHTYRSGAGQLGYLNDGRIGSIAKLQSPDMENLNAQCFTFWFMRSGGNGVQLKVSIFHVDTNEYEKVWQSELSRHISDEWIRVQNTIVVRDKMNIVLETTKIDNSVTRVVIDDLSFEAGRCQPVINCQFMEDGNFCGWKDAVQNNDRIWSVGFGRVMNPAALTFTNIVSNLNNLLYTDFTTMPTGGTSSMEMLSEFVDSNTYTQGACVTLRYDVAALSLDSDLFELNQIDTNGNRVQLWKYSNNNHQWQSQTIFIPNPAGNLPYRLSLRVKSSHASTYVGIYTIIYNQEAYSCNNAITRPPATQPPPPPTVGPKRTMNCDFENSDLCNWRAPSSAGGYSFKLGTPSMFNNSLYFPPKDHTKSNGTSGHYAFFYATGTTAPKPIIATLTGVNPYPEQYICVKFWYYFYAAPGANFTMQFLYPAQQNNNQNPSYQLFQAYGANDIAWRQAEFTVGAIFGTFKFQASIVKGVLALDDITVMPGQCAYQQIKAQQQQQSCDFESNYCNYLSPVYNAARPQNQYYWKLYTGTNVSRAMTDHTTHTNMGHFYGFIFGLVPWTSVQMPTGQNSAVANKIQVTTRSMHVTQVQCVRFAYYTEGLTTNTSFYYDLVGDYMQTTGPRVFRIFTVSGSTSGLWFTHRFPIPKNTTYQYFHILMSIDTNGVDPGKAKVFIDDFALDPLPCGQTKVCDFEAGDTCDMEPILVNSQHVYPAARKNFLARTANNTAIPKTGLIDYVDQAWHVFSPRQSVNYIQHDHTLGSADGKYLLLHGEGVSDRGIMITRRYQLGASDSNGTFCFSFAMYKPTDSAVLEVYQGEPGDSGHGLKLVDLRGATGSDWQVFDIQTTLQNPYSQDIFFYLVGTLPNPSKDYIAIDDVQMVQSRQCNPVNPLANSPGQSPSKNGSKGGLIAGILVPLFVIAAAVVGYFGYKRYQAQKVAVSDDQQQQVLSYNNLINERQQK